MNTSSISVAAVIRTNVPRQSIRKDFMSKFTDYLCESFNTDIKHTNVEIHADVLMMRGGLSTPMMNISLYHNTNVISQTTKVNNAEPIAKFMAEEMKIPIDRVLVLFFDTRKCT
ncbi:hypothetical protein FSP39_001114 [Pinctada imbricata]|uniref:L-dopachrome isomerase n=1 Tax=Pinctada imbricata TaxID=66713 RepID=A0AA89C4N3_PINIB|nr:hypothetical protein FSP39_001114 [Pinctada imbricata]